MNEYKKYKKEISVKRYRDYNSLLYSMRSVYKNVKFAKNWFLILSGESQIPNFLNVKKNENGEYIAIYNDDNILDEDKIKLHIIFHKDIFPLESELPNIIFN